MIRCHPNAIRLMNFKKGPVVIYVDPEAHEASIAILDKLPWEE